LPNPPKETGGSAPEELPALTQAAADAWSCASPRTSHRRTYGLRAAKAGFLPTLSAFGITDQRQHAEVHGRVTGSIGGRLDSADSKRRLHPRRDAEARGRRRRANNR